MSDLQIVIMVMGMLIGFLIVGPLLQAITRYWKSTKGVE